MAKRSRFTRIRDHVISVLSNIRASIQELWTTIQEFCTSEESSNRNDACGGFVLLTDISNVKKEDQCTNSEEILKVSMACQTDLQLFNNALNALGKSVDDCYIGNTHMHMNKKRSSKTSKSKADLDGSLQQHNILLSNFNENYSAERNRRKSAPSSAPVQITRSPLPLGNETPQPARSAGFVDNFSEMREEDMANQQRRRKNIFNKYPKDMCGSSISKTIYHVGKRSIGTSAFVKSADAFTQTFMSIEPSAIFLPLSTTPSTDNQRTSETSGEKIGDHIKDKSKGFQSGSKTSVGKTCTQELPSDSVFHFNGSPTPVKKDVKANTKISPDKQRKTLTPDEKVLSVPDCSKLSDKGTVAHKIGRRDKTPTKPDEQKSPVQSNESQQNLNAIKTNTTPIVKEENSKMPNESKVPVETKADSPHRNISKRVAAAVTRADGRTENANAYGRENYIKVMLLKIVEKIPHIKKMKKRQDSLAEDDPERDRLFKAINTEIKKNIKYGMEKFYVRYNKLHPSQRVDTTKLEKDFLMDLISEMKKTDKEFLAEEVKTPSDAYLRQKGDGQIEEVSEAKKMDIAQIKELEYKHNQRLEQSQESKRQAEELENASVNVTRATSTEVQSKPKHRNKTRHRKNEVTESPVPLPDDNKLVTLFSEQQKSEKDIHIENLEEEVQTNQEALSLTEETTASEAGTSEGDIIDLMNDLEDEAHRDGLFTNWDATPFGDIAEFFDRGHYRIDGQAMVSKGGRGSKVDARPQKVKRRGIPNKHLQNTSNYLQESAGDTQKDWLLEEDANDVEADDAVLENTDESVDFDIAHETLACLDNTEKETNLPANEEPVVDTRHLQDMPCDVIMKKKGECDLLEEKYSVCKPPKNKAKPRKKKTKKSSIYAANYSNNADDEWSDDGDDDESDSDSDDQSDLCSDDEISTDSDESENEVAYQARIARYTEMLQTIHLTHDDDEQQI